MLETLAQLAIATLARPGRGLSNSLQPLVAQVLGWVAVTVILTAALLCALAGGMLALAPRPLDWPQALLAIAAVFVLAAGAVWLVACRARAPHRMVAEALEQNAGPLDQLGDSLDRVKTAFTRGWHNGAWRPYQRWDS